MPAMPIIPPIKALEKMKKLRSPKIYGRVKAGRQIVINKNRLDKKKDKM